MNLLNLTLSLLLTILQDYVVSDEVNVSEKFVINSKIKDIQWAGKHNTNVFVLTYDSELFRSKDSGRTWTNLNDMFFKDENEKGFAKLIKVNQKYSDVIIVLGFNKTHFVSSDGGLTFAPFNASGIVENVIYHPTNKEKFLFSLTSEGCYNQADSKLSCFRSLFVTTDLGKSYKKLVDYVVQYSWGDVKHKNEDYIYITKFDQSQGDQPKNVAWYSNINFGVIKNLASTFKTIIEGGNKFLVSNGFIFVAKQTKNFTEQSVVLFTSSDGGNNFNKIKLPDDLTEKSYTILDTDNNSVMIHINHGYIHGNDISVGNVYTSDENGQIYSLSLKNIVRGANGECEIEAVASLENTYLANYLETKMDTYNFEGLDNEKDLTRNLRNLNKEFLGGKLIKTVISFDNGGYWHYLKPPAIDSLGDEINCNYQSSINQNSKSNLCSLNLHGVTEFHRFAPFYSSKNAVGMVMGTGNVGDYLSFNSSEINTYLSRDGGVNWVEVHKGAYIYEFGDHGGLIVMASSDKATKEIVFSWDEGNTWYDFHLSEEPVKVENIVVEPNTSSVEFLVYGDQGSKSVVYHLDFSTLKQPICKGALTAGSVSSDYELWNQSDGINESNCILGRKITYVRRKPSAQCFNGKDFIRTVEKKACKCTESDFECNFGFSRKVGSFECKIQHIKYVQENCTSSPILYADAFRKIPGNACKDGWTPPKIPIRCSNLNLINQRSRNLIKFVLFLLFIISISMLYTGRYSFYELMKNNNYSVYQESERLIEQSFIQNKLNFLKRKIVSDSKLETQVSIYGSSEEANLDILNKPNEIKDSEIDDDQLPLVDLSLDKSYNVRKFCLFHLSKEHGLEICKKN